MPRVRGASLRLADFERRAQFAPESVSRYEPKWRYIEVHPFADDVDTLRRIGVKPEHCISVDAWCQAGEDAYFVEVAADRGRLVQLRARRQTETKFFAVFTATIPNDVVTRAAFEHVLDLIELHGLVANVEETLGADYRTLGEGGGS